MSAEPRQPSPADIWTTCQDQVVQGRFVLRRCLGWSDHAAVFLTEHKAKNLAEAAVKLVRADAPQAQTLLARWQAAANLSHQNLVQLFELGRWQTDGQDYLFVVMEYADQTLAQILRHRALNAEEVQELLPPVLEALTFLHRRQLAHTRLQPSNFMAVGDQLKLASDTVRPAGQDHATSTAGDVWNFGATLVEALTAQARISIHQRFDVTSLPAGLPAMLVDTIQRCLNPSAADRPSIIELRAENKKPPPAASVAKPEPPVSQTAVPAQTPSKVAVSYPPAPNSQRAVAPPQPANIAPRVAPQPQLTSNTSQEVAPRKPAPNVVPQTVRTEPRVATPPQPAPSPQRRPTPPQVEETASRFAVSFQAVLSGSQVSAQPQPIPSKPRETASPQPANVPARVAAPAPAAPRAPGQVASAQDANMPPRVAPPAQPMPSPSREVASAQHANIAPRVAAPAQLAPGALRNPAVAQAATKTPHEAIPTPATHTRTASPIQAPPIAQREVAPAQPAPIDPRVVAPGAAPTNSRVFAPPPPTNSTVVARSAPTNSQVVTPPAAPTNARVVIPPAAPTNSRVIAPPDAPSSARDLTPRQPAKNVPAETGPVEGAPKRHILGIAAGAFLLVIAVWIGLRSTHDSPAPSQPTAVPTPVASPPPATIATAEPPTSTPIPEPLAEPAPPATSSASVLNEVIPTVPDKIQSDIQGHLYVTVRALVDPAGNVMGVLMENAGPSKYFARISEQAAREWQFVPAETEDARVWLIRFEYTNSGVSVRTFEQ